MKRMKLGKYFMPLDSVHHAPIEGVDRDGKPAFATHLRRAVMHETKERAQEYLTNHGLWDDCVLAEVSLIAELIEARGTERTLKVMPRP